MSLALDSIEPIEPGVGVFVAVALLVCASLVPSALMGRRGRQATRADATPLILAPLADAPKFSVIVPTFNRAALVLEAVQSVLVQSYANFELIVVDDGSTDDTVERLRRIGDRRLSVVRLPDKLTIELDFLRRHPDVGLVFGDLEKYDGACHVASFMRTTDVFSKRLPQARTDGFVLTPREMYLCLLQEVPVKTPAMTVRREVLAAVGTFDELWTSAEDWELLLRLARVTAFGYVDRPLAVIRVSPDSLHRRDQERGDRAMLRLLAERRRHAADAETREAAARGIVRRSNHLGWYYVDRGRRIDSAATHLRSLVVTRKPSLLLRAGAALIMPRHVARAPEAPIDPVAA